MAKTLESLGTVNFTSFAAGKAIFKADRNATGNFAIQSLALGGYTTQTGRDGNRVALTVSGPDGEVTYRLDFNDTWLEGSTPRRRYSGSVVTDIAAMVAVIQDKGLDYVKTLDLDSRAAASKDDRELFAHIAPGKSIKVTIIPGSAKNDDGLYPLMLEWALSRSNQRNPHFVGVLLPVANSPVNAVFKIFRGMGSRGLARGIAVCIVSNHMMYSTL